MSDQQPRYCVNCKFLSGDRPGVGGLGRLCDHPHNITINLVTGDKGHMYTPAQLRDGGGCGYPGMWFKPKEQKP